MSYDDEEYSDYNFLDYLLDHDLLAGRTWSDVAEIDAREISLAKDSFYSGYKRYCREHGYSIEKIF